MIAVPAGALPPSSASSRVTDYRDSGCGCCEGWAAAGYSVHVNDIEYSARLRRFAISPNLAGCHTAAVGRYLVEGHVPLEALAQLLRERPRIRGIALPGMPRIVVLDALHRVYYTG